MSAFPLPSAVGGARRWPVWLWLCGLFWIAVHAGPAAAAGGVTPEGVLFSDPRVITPMPDGWLRRSIRYGGWAGKADLAVTLDQQIYAFLLPSIQAFARDNHLNIQVREGTCGTSSGMLIRKQVDMAGFCCPPGVTDRLPGLRFHTLGIAAIAVLVHPGNPLENLPVETLREIFRGDRFRWSEVEVAPGRNGVHRMIHTIGRLHCKLRPGHWRALLNSSDGFSPRLNEVGAIPDMIFQVMASPDAIGYETLWHVRRNAERGWPKVVAIDGLDPRQPGALTSGGYPFYRVFNVTSWADGGLKNPHADRLVAHLKAAVAQLESTYGLVPATTLRAAGWRFQDDELVGEPVREAPPDPER